MANGRLKDSELEVVEDNDRLNHVTAFWFRGARAAWYAEGGSGSCIVERAGAYRTFQVQYDMKHGIPSYAYWNLNPLNKTGLATPGTSTHGLGDTLDATTGFQSFLLRRGAEFGFYRPLGKSDPNHWRCRNTTIPAGIPGTPLPVETAARRLAMTARFVVAPGPLWAGIDLVAFRSQGGVIVTTVQATADNLSRVYPFPAEDVSREELNNSAIAARLWVAQVVNPSMGGAAAVDPKVLAAELAPLLRLGDSDLTEAEFVSHLARAVSTIQATIPPAVILEQKKPGN